MVTAKLVDDLCNTPGCDPGIYYMLSALKVCFRRICSHFVIIVKMTSDLLLPPAERAARKAARQEEQQRLKRRRIADCLSMSVSEGIQNVNVLNNLAANMR